MGRNGRVVYVCGFLVLTYGKEWSGGLCVWVLSLDIGRNGRVVCMWYFSFDMGKNGRVVCVWDYSLDIWEGMVG